MRTAKSFAKSIMLLGCMLAIGAIPGSAATFNGEIYDSPCAAMGSHEKGFTMTKTTTAKGCTIACVNMMNGKYTLYDATSNKTYQLDDQDLAKKFAEQKVTVTGDYSAQKKLLHVTKIEPSH